MTGSSQAPARNWHRIGIALVVATMGYNVVEAGLALWGGIEADSIALVGFGLDSIIECVAAGALLWRLSVEARGAEGDALERAERRVHRVFGFTFLLLAVYVTAQGSWTLWNQVAPNESTLGIIVAGASLVVMPLVSWGKFRAAREIGTAALRAETKETLACSYLSFTLLLGLVANATFGWWWADPAAALLMVPWLIKEGCEGLSGDGCCDHN